MSTVSKVHNNPTINTKFPCSLYFQIDRINFYLLENVIHPELFFHDFCLPFKAFNGVFIGNFFLNALCSNVEIFIVLYKNILNEI